jgi:hypothetical protein
MKRRRFLTGSLELVIAARCLPLLGVPLLNAAAAAAQLRPGTKPPLTEASLNAIIPADTAGMRTFAGQMFPDMKSFIRARFTLSPEQETALAGMSNESVERIQNAVLAAIAKGAKVSVIAVADSVPVDQGGCIRQNLRIR